MWRWAFLVVRAQLSSPNPNFSKPRTRTANSNFWSWLTHKLLGRFKFTIPNLQIDLPKKGKFWEIGVGDRQSTEDISLSLRMNKCLERVNGRHFWNPGVCSFAMITRWRPNLKFFFIVTSIVYASDYRLQIRMCVKKFRVGTGQYLESVKWIEGFTTWGKKNVLESTSFLQPLASKTSFTEWYAKSPRAPTLICLPCASLACSKVETWDYNLVIQMKP